MARRILGVLAGLLGAMGVITGMERANLWLFPVPSGLDVKDPKAFNDYVAMLPISAFLLVLLAHALAALLGAMVATLVAKRSSVWPAMVVGAALMAGGIANVLTISHPVWFSLLDVMIYGPTAYGGAWLLLRRADAPSAEP